MTIKLVTDEKIAETSSKGNQEKWLDQGVWYKLDQFGYEALAETLVSMILECSNVEIDTPFRSVIINRVTRKLPICLTTLLTVVSFKTSSAAISEAAS